MGYNKRRVKTHSKFGLSSKAVQWQDKGGGGDFDEDPFNAIPALNDDFNELATDGQWNYFPTETSVQVIYEGIGSSPGGAAVRTIPIWETDYTGVNKFPPYTCIRALGTVATQTRFNMYQLTSIPIQITPFNNAFVFSTSNNNANYIDGEEITGQSASSGLLTFAGNNLGGVFYYAPNMQRLDWQIYLDSTIPTTEKIHLNFHLMLF